VDGVCIEMSGGQTPVIRLMEKMASVAYWLNAAGPNNETNFRVSGEVPSVSL